MSSPWALLINQMYAAWKATMNRINPVCSYVHLSASTVAAGGTVTATLYLRDRNKQPVVASGIAVRFVPTTGGGVSTLTVGAVTDHGDGSYTATLTGGAAGTAASIGATYDGNPVKSAKPTLTVSAAVTYSLARSLVTVAAPTVASGGGETVTLTTRDSGGNQVYVAGLTVAFTRSGGTSTGTFGGVTDHLDGTYTATFTGVTSGSPTSISATINTSAVTSALPTIQVTSGAISVGNSTFVPSSSTVVSGSGMSLVLTLKDGSSNRIVTPGIVPTFTASGGTSTGTIGAVTDNGDGTYSATFTGAASGSSTTITAKVNGLTITQTASVAVAVGPIAVATSPVTLSASTVASGGTVTATLTAKDAGGNALSVGGSTVLFTPTGGVSTVTVGATTDHGDGTYTAVLTGVKAGTPTSVRATIGGALVTYSPIPTLTVTYGARSLSTGALSVAPTSVTSGGTATITYIDKDAQGNRITVGGATVAFSLSGGTSTGAIGSTTDHGDGSYTAVLTGQAAGTAATVNATVNGSAFTGTKPTVTVVAATTPSMTLSTLAVASGTVASGGTDLVTFTARDASNNRITTGGLTVTFNGTVGSSTGTFSATTDHGDGTYTATFSGILAGTALTIGATAGGQAFVGTKPTIQVTPGAISAATSTVTVASPTVASGLGDVATLIAKDAQGNRLTAGGSTVVLNASGGTSTGTFGAVTDNGNGTYSATFTGVVAGTATNIGATIGGVAVTTARPTVQVTPGAYSASRSAVTVNGGASANVTAGNTAVLLLTLRDAAGNLLGSSGAGKTVVFLESGGSGVSVGTISPTTDNGNGTYGATFTGSTPGSPTSIVATVNGVQTTSTAPTITVSSAGGNPLQTAGPVGPVGYSLTLPAQDVDGWTVIPPLAADAREIFVSSSTGNDANSGLSSSLPKRTLRAAWQLMRKGIPDRLRLKRGDTWNEKMELWATLWSGRSRTEPQILMDYGDPSAALPSIQPLPTGSTLAWNGVTCVEFQSAVYNHIWFLNLKLYQPSGDPSSPSFGTYYNLDADGVTHLQASGAATYLKGSAASYTDMLWENCHLSWCHHGFDLNNGTADLRIRRCRITDITAYDHAFANPFWVICDSDVVVEECIFTNNGGTPQGAKFAHNMYFSINANSSLRNNLYLDSTGVGVKLTASTLPSGSAEHSFSNLWVDSNLFMGGEPWWVQGFSSDFQCSDPTKPGYVQAAHYNQLFSGNVHTDLEVGGYDCQTICSDQTHITGNYWINAFQIDTSGQRLAPLVVTTGVYGPDSSGTTLIDGNTVYRWVPTSLPIITYLAANQIGSNTPTNTAIQTAATIGANDLNLPASAYVDPSRTVARYDAEVLGGPGTLAHFRTLCRQQSRDSWNPALMAQAVCAWIKAGFVKV